MEVCTKKDKVNVILEITKDGHLDDSKKITFLTEQLSLAFSRPNGRRYSSSLIDGLSVTICLACNQVHLRTVNSAIAGHFKLTQPAKRYLSARFIKLKEIDRMSRLFAPNASFTY